MDEFLDVDQLAAKFGLSRSWVYKICSLELIAFYKIGNRTFFKQADVDDFIERQRKPCQFTSEKTGTENTGFGFVSSKVARQLDTTATAEAPEPKRNWRNVN